DECNRLENFVSFLKECPENNYLALEDSKGTKNIVLKSTKKNRSKNTELATHLQHLIDQVNQPFPEKKSITEILNIRNFKVSALRPLFMELLGNERRINPIHNSFPKKWDKHFDQIDS